MNPTYIVLGVVVALGILVVLGRGSSSSKSYPLSRDATDEDIRTLAEQGKKIEAIKLYRALHGTGIKEAKDAVEDMLLGRNSSSQSNTSENVSDNDIRILAQQGKIIQAIKSYRVLHGVGLKEAKDAVEEMMEKL